MRFAHSSRLSKFTLLACVTAGLVAGGCNGYEHGFLAPADAGRFKNEPLLKPIITTLDTGFEEPNDLFAQATDVQPDDLVASQQDYTIGKNDLLSVSITDLMGPGVETVKQVRVSESGKISLPLVGQVHAEGLTEAQMETEIQRVYREANLIPNATVSVQVSQALARIFSILGTVQRPGQYQITQVDFRILDALVSAGDITSQGVDDIYVIRRKDLANGPKAAESTTPNKAPASRDVLQPRSEATGVNQPVLLATDKPAVENNGEGHYITVDGKQVLVGNQGATAEPAAAPAAPAPAAAPAVAAPAASPAATTQGFEFQNPMSADNTRLIKVPVTQLKNGDLRYNIVIRPQDMIIVPQPTTGEYYMDGHVNRTGVYNLTARKITLQQAVAAAGGYDQLALPMRTEIIRRIGDDKQVYAMVDLDKIACGLQPDIYLKPNDVVRVGTDVIAPFVSAFRNAFRFTYGFGFLYDRNFAPQQKIAELVDLRGLPFAALI